MKIRKLIPKKKKRVSKSENEARTKKIQAGGILLGDGTIHTKEHEKLGWFVGLWNMEKTHCRVVKVKVVDGDSIHSHPWWKPYIGEEFQAIEIVTHGITFHIANEDGSGMAKITVGRGHFSAGHAQFENVEVLETITDPKEWVMEYDFEKSNAIAERGESYWFKHDIEWWKNIRELRLNMVAARKNIEQSVDEMFNSGQTK